MQKFRENIDNPIIIYGDADFNTSMSGGASSPVKALKKEIYRIYNTYPMDEYNTSQKCCECRQQLRSMTNNGLLTYAAKICSNKLCPLVVLDRDDCASSNMLYIAEYQITHCGRRPQEFDRKKEHIS